MAKGSLLGKVKVEQDQGRSDGGAKDPTVVADPRLESAHWLILTDQ